MDTPRHAYQRIRNYLAGQFVGATRDKTLLDEVVKCLFARAHIVRMEETSTITNDPISISKKYRRALKDVISSLPTLFEPDTEILLDPKSVAFVDQELSTFDILSIDNDPLTDAYQTFISSEFRGQDGQFFTPTAAVSWLVEAIDPKKHEKIIDPACGSGAFLNYAARYLLKRGVSDAAATSNITGIEKDAYLARLAAQHIALTTGELPNIFCADSLNFRSIDGTTLPSDSFIEAFDLVLANPPFGVKITIAENVRAGFQLALKSTKATNGKFQRTATLSSRTPPQVLFLERILTLLRPGGRAGIVVPESLIASPKYAHVVDFLLEKTEVTSVVGMPESLFKTSGKGGTHTKTCLLTFVKRAARKRKATPAKIYLAEAKWCGHDSRANRVDRDDLPVILKEFKAQAPLYRVDGAHGIWIEQASISDHVLAPRYYDPEGARELRRLTRTHKLVRFGDLVDCGAVEYTTGVEIGKLAYGTGHIPFVRTSDISGWEVKLDPKHGVSRDVYIKYAPKVDVRHRDILMVKDGTYLVGNCAIISKYDEEILFQSHLYKIRVMDESTITPELLLAVLSSDPVQRQIKSKQLTQDIIDSLGGRIKDLILPIPKSDTHRSHIAMMVARIVSERAEAREGARRAMALVVSTNVVRDNHEISNSPSSK